VNDHRIATHAAGVNRSVEVSPEANGAGHRPAHSDAPMIPIVFELITMLAVLGLGFVLGRIWEIRQQEILRRDHERAGFGIPTAHIPQ
jgi:hypothetical protein